MTSRVVAAVAGHPELRSFDDMHKEVIKKAPQETKDGEKTVTG